MVYWIVIPVYNGVTTLPELLERISRAVPDPGILAVDDGSTDGTAELLTQMRIKCIRHPENRGKGEALRSGFAEVLKEPVDAVVHLDADLQHEPEYLPDFFAAFESGKGDLIIGTRDFQTGGMPFPRRMTNRLTSWAVRRMTGTSIADSQSGYRLIGRRVLEAIHPESRHFEFESEYLVLAARAGFAIGEIPISTVYHGGPSSIRPWRDTMRFLRLMALSWCGGRQTHRFQHRGPDSNVRQQGLSE